jgi:hypothetical protein
MSCWHRVAAPAAWLIGTGTRIRPLYIIRPSAETLDDWCARAVAVVAAVPLNADAWHPGMLPWCRCTILLADMADFGKVNEIYGKCFPENPPARATFAVKDLPAAARVEIDCVAVL